MTPRPGSPPADWWPDADGIAALAELAAGWISLAHKPAAERQAGAGNVRLPVARRPVQCFAVGWIPGSVAAIREALAGAGYEIDCGLT